MGLASQSGRDGRFLCHIYDGGNANYYVHEAEPQRTMTTVPAEQSSPTAVRSLWFPSDTAVAFLLFTAAFAIRLPFLWIAPNNTTDAWSRYHYAILWLQRPAELPHATSVDAWLPLHFWLLGAVIWVTKSEMGARVFTALLGAMTVPFFWGIVKRAFDPDVALASSIALILFDFHIAFSVTTGSEIPTIFFMAAGAYAWLRYASDEGWHWALLSALMLGAACLCRFEAWLFPPVLALMTLDSGSGFRPFSLDSRTFKRALIFTCLAAASPVGWLTFSYLKWGDPLELPHRTAWLNLHFRPTVLRHDTTFRLFSVPGSLLVSLSPLVALLACVGFVCVFRQSSRPARSLVLLALTMLIFNYWSALRYEATQARYTLLYSWLLLPCAFFGGRCLAKRWNGVRPRAVLTATLIFFFLWQLAVVAAAAYAPPKIADRLGGMSPTLPLHHEMRGLTSWLLRNHPPSQPVVLDDFNWESAAISRFAHLDPDVTFGVTATHYANPITLKPDLEQFVANNHPLLLICSPYGPIGTMWSVDSRQQLDVPDFGLHLELRWAGERWRVYAITYGSRSGALTPGLVAP